MVPVCQYVIHTQGFLLPRYTEENGKTICQIDLANMGVMAKKYTHSKFKSQEKFVKYQLYAKFANPRVRDSEVTLNSQQSGINDRHSGNKG